MTKRKPKFDGIQRQIRLRRINSLKSTKQTQTKKTTGRLRRLAMRKAWKKKNA